MARMYPEKFPPFASAEDRWRGQAEKTVYDFLKRYLPQSYTVLYRIPWSSPQRAGGIAKGEIDFVVVHPAHGVLIIEVKGGLIKYDGLADKWTSTDSNGDIHDIDPFNQLDRNVRYLKWRLKDWPLTKNHSYPLAYAVWFPSTSERVARLPPNVVPELILNSRDLDSPETGLLRVFDSCLGKNRRDMIAPPGKIAIDGLVETIRPSSEISTSLGADLTREKEVIRQLTDEQYLVLDDLARNRRMLISGIAGSGKTMLAVEKARRLAKQGYEVLLTCFNRPLADDLYASLREEKGIEVYNFHRVCEWYARMAKLPRSGADYFDTFLPNALAKAVETVYKRYDAIVVDEGQLFLENWWTALLCLLRDPDNGIMYVFFDDNQMLYTDKRHALPPFDTTPYSLSVNCRNTQAIHRAFRPYYRGDRQIVCLREEGREVETHTVERTSDAARAKLRRILHHLVNEEHVRLQDIVILTPIENGSLWQEGMRLGNFIISRIPNDPTPSTVLCSTIKRFVGLERAVVILTEMDRVWDEPDAQSYIAMSRATSQLIILQQE